MKPETRSIVIAVAIAVLHACGDAFVILGEQIQQSAQGQLWCYEVILLPSRVIERSYLRVTNVSRDLAKPMFGMREATTRAPLALTSPTPYGSWIETAPNCCDSQPTII
jgi:hypothetical protein